MFKKLSIFLLGYIVSTAIYATTNSTSDEGVQTEIWHCTWASSIYPGSSYFLSVKLNDFNEYYTQWDAEPPEVMHVTGDMYIIKTTDSFQGETYYQTNGDHCTVGGIIKGVNVSGQYYCKSGDKGSVTGYITYGTYREKIGKNLDL
jgi:hypothetical protein